MALTSIHRHSRRRPASAKRATRGSTLLEAIAAVALSGLFLSTSLGAIGTAGNAIRTQSLVDRAITLTRDHLEHAIAIPCGAPPPCETPFACSTSRTIVSVPTVDTPAWVLRLTTEVATDIHRDALPDGVALSTLVTRAALCAS